MRRTDGINMRKTHLLCYVPRDHLTSWKLDSLERGALAYGSDAATFADLATKGSILWVIGARRDGPPSLEARIEIAARIRNPDEWKFEVRDSRGGGTYFALNDASKVLMDLVFESNESFSSLRNTYSSTSWRSAYGQSLQLPRRIAPAGARIHRHRSAGVAPLERLARSARQRSVFVSWKHADGGRAGRRFLKALTTELAVRGFSVWWDGTALTGVHVMQTDRAGRRDVLLSKLLRQGISEASAVLSLWTERYGKPSTPEGRNWTRSEWNVDRRIKRIAMAHGRFEDKRGMADPDSVLRIPASPDEVDAVRVARSFQRTYDSL